MPADEAETARAAFSRAMLPHLDAAYNLARWLVRDADAAQDVVQDAMVRALTYFPGFRGENPRAWLLRIVRATAYSRVARQRHAAEAPLPGEDEPALPDPGPGPEAALAQREDAATLDAALAALPIELRECLVLRELEEMSYRDIARVTGVPAGTVMSRLWRARQALLRHGQQAAPARPATKEVAR
jgi:RNA polymerase sigma-70 factor (ECF subfamily)